MHKTEREMGQQTSLTADRSQERQSGAETMAAGNGRIPSYSTTPNRAWDMLSVKQTVKTVQPIDPDTPKPPGHTRFVCISGAAA